MAVTIKLKNASGSDPSASDLVLGELAVRTDNGKIFLKKDDGNVAEVSGGGIDDGDKGDITVSNSGATFTIDNDAVTYAKIQNVSATNRILGRDSSGAGVIEEISPSSLRTMINVEDGATADQTASDIKTLLNSSGLVNAQIDGSAAIAGSKISPNFTSAMDVDGSITCDDIITAGALLHEGDTNTLVHFTANDEISLKTNGSTRFKAHNSGVDVTGNIGVSGTVDGVDIAARNTLFGGLTSSSGVLSNGVTATTQSASDNSTKVATTAYTDTAISNLINGAPAALDTLNELAAAMNDDAAFSTTVTNSLATKMPLAGGQFTGNITFSGSQTVDGRDLSTDGSKLDGIESGATADQSASEILTLIKTVDGSGSGLDADELDGIAGAGYLRSNTNDTMSANLTLSTNNSYPLDIDGDHNAKIVLQGSSNPYIRFREGTTDRAFIQWDANGYLTLQNQEDASILRIKDDIDFSPDDGSNYHSLYHEGNLSVGDGGLTQNNFTNTLKSKLDGIESGATADQSASEILTLIKTVDGAGSGLDADQLDGVQGSGYLNTGTGTQQKTGALRIGNSSHDLALSYNGTFASTSVGHTASNDEGIFWHTDNSYGIYRTAGAWTGNYQQLKLKWSTGIILDGGTSYGLSGVRVNCNFLPLTDSARDIGSNSLRFANGYFDTLYGNGSNLTNLPSQTDNNFTTTLKNKLDGIAASATNVTNNNQLTNGAGYTTYTANQAVNTGSGPTFSNVYCNGWLRNNDVDEGLYNQSTGQHFYSDDSEFWAMDGNGNTGGIRFRDNHASTIRGYVYFTNSNQVGFLDSDGQWAVQVERDVSVNFRVNGSVEAEVLPDTFRIRGAFYENYSYVTADKTISNGYNAMSAGPITVNNSVTVTIGSGEVWTII